MEAAKSLEAWNAYIDCQGRCAKEASKGSGQREQVFVTISRQTGAGGITIGRLLVQYLRDHDEKTTCPWTVFDKTLVEAVLKEHHLPKKFAEFMPEQNVSEVRDMVEEMMGLHPAAWMLVHMTSETILHLAKMGNSVIVGRGANIVTRKLNHGLHVRLVGSLEKRIKHIQDYYKLAREQAEHFIKDEDRGRASYLNRHFGRDIDDPLNYSLVLNTDRVSYDEAAKLIGDQAIRQLA